MTQIVSFPGLGFSFEINPDAFSIGSLTIKWYGILFAGAIFCWERCMFEKYEEIRAGGDRVIDVLRCDRFRRDWCADLLCGLFLGYVSG